ncbi:hypothetical protein [Trichothermofontia sp.]
MRQVRRFWFLAIGFCTAIVAYLLTPGQWLNRLVAVALCTVLTTDQVCLPHGMTGRAVAAMPRVEVAQAEAGLVAQQADDRLIAQRSSEFDDVPVTPAPSNTVTPPPYPSDPGPNFPVRRPDFDDNNTYQGYEGEAIEINLGPINQSGQDLWILAAYESLDSQNPLLLFPVNLKLEDLPNYNQASASSQGNVELVFDEENSTLLSYSQDSNQSFIAAILQDTRDENNKLYLLAIPLGRGNTVNTIKSKFISKNQYSISISKQQLARIPESERTSAARNETLKWKDNVRNNQNEYLRNNRNLNFIKKIIPPKYRPLVVSGSKFLGKVAKALPAIVAVATLLAATEWAFRNPQTFSRCISSTRCRNSLAPAVISSLWKAGSDPIDFLSDTILSQPTTSSQATTQPSLAQSHGNGSGQCGEEQVSGGQAGDRRRIQLTSNRGTVSISYEHYDVPDRLQVIYEGKTVIDTGFVPNTGNASFNLQGQANFVDVVVTGNPQQSTTEWNYTLSCPQQIQQPGQPEPGQDRFFDATLSQSEIPYNSSAILTVRYVNPDNNSTSIEITSSSFRGRSVES